MEYKQGITAVLIMFNEENRISNTLKCFSWCDQIIILDKDSTDDSIEISSKFKNVKIVQKDFKDSKNYFLDSELFLTSHIRTNWYIVITASDVITKKLGLEIKSLIKRDFGDFNCISIPYKPYFMGINETFSPWYYKTRRYIYKTETIKTNNSSVHGVLTMSCKPKQYNITFNDNKEALYHLTHENYEGVLDRYYRYLMGEKNDDISLSNQLKYIVRQVIKLVIFKRVLFRGKAAVALTFSFLSYHMLKYVVLWDSRYGNGINTYAKIREKISNEWS